MECASSASVDDLDSLSDDDEVALLAECIGRQIELPTASESIPVPSWSNQQRENRARTPRLSYIAGFMFDVGYFDLGMGRGPVARDSRLRNDHAINICSQLIPIVDTPMSPSQWTNTQQATGERLQNHKQQCPSGIHFKGPSGDDNPYITGCTDCLIWGKSVEQIQDEAVIDYLHKTAVRGESPEQFNARSLAFLEGMKVGCFMLIPGGVSHASACDGNMYSICHEYQKALPSTTPLNWNS